MKVEFYRCDRCNRTERECKTNDGANNGKFYTAIEIGLTMSHVYGNEEAVVTKDLCDTCLGSLHDNLLWAIRNQSNEHVVLNFAPGGITE